MNLEIIKARCIEEGECWIWQGAYSSNGYPIMKSAGFKGGCLLVRRVVVELDGRPAAPRQPVAASCNDKRCCNPACLKPSSTSAIGKKAGKNGAYSRMSRRAKIATAKRIGGKLNFEQAAEIRMSKESGPVLAARYGIDKSMVNNIKRGDAWRDYSSPFAGLMT